jgi:hypothetical protein
MGRKKSALSCADILEFKINPEPTLCTVLFLTVYHVAMLRRLGPNVKV